MCFRLSSFFSPVQQDQIIDWLSPDFHQKELLPLLALIMLTIAALALSPKRVRPSDLLLYSSDALHDFKVKPPHGDLRARRWPNARRLLAALARDDAIRAHVRRIALGYHRKTKLIFNIILLMPLIACLIKLKSVIYSPPTQEQVGVPLNAVSYLKDKRDHRETFTDPNIWGGYLIWETPSNPVYIDGRIDMYGDEFMREYLGIIRGITRWQEPFDKYGVQVAIVSPTSQLRLQLEQSPQWQNSTATKWRSSSLVRID